jgi:hypothetical protein
VRTSESTCSSSRVAKIDDYRSDEAEIERWKEALSDNDQNGKESAWPAATVVLREFQGIDNWVNQPGEIDFVCSTNCVGIF